MNIIKEITLYCQTGSSDKVYQLQINEVEGGHMLYFANARRGAALTPKAKTTQPVTLAEAEKLFTKTVAEKAKKGYVESPDGGNTLAPATNAEKDSGVRLQLLTVVDDSELESLLSDDAYCASVKWDGERRPILVKDGKVSGLNRYGEYVGLKREIANGINSSVDMLVDGEDMGRFIACFDLLEYNGKDYRPYPFWIRQEKLSEIISHHPALALTRIAQTTEEKRALLEEVKEANGEGCVFKRIDAPFAEGRPNKGGSQRKYKLYKEASVRVSAVNSQRSVEMSVLTDSAEWRCVGNVTIPANAEIPPLDAVIEVRYLYAYTAGSLFQPTFLRQRPDLRVSECAESQLAYKADAAQESEIQEVFAL